MRYCCAALFMALSLVPVVAQKPKVAPKKETSPQVPKAVSDQLQKIADRLKETASDVVERKPGEFVKFKLVASKVTARAEKSDFADKPYAATITWISEKQESKIYGDKASAEKSKEWLEPGKVAGSGNAYTVPKHVTAKLFYTKNGKWEIDEITSGSDLSGISAPRGVSLPVDSTKKPSDHPWGKVLLGEK